MDNKERLSALSQMHNFRVVINPTSVNAVNAGLVCFNMNKSVLQYRDYHYRAAKCYMKYNALKDLVVYVHGKMHLAGCRNLAEI